MIFRASALAALVALATVSACSSTSPVPSNDTGVAPNVAVVIALRDRAGCETSSSVVVVLVTPTDGRSAASTLKIGDDLVDVVTSFEAYRPPNDSVVSVTLHRTGAHPFDAKLRMTPPETEPNFRAGPTEFPFHVFASYPIESSLGFSSELVSYGLLLPSAIDPRAL